jgi:hypothetical protein
MFLETIFLVKIVQCLVLNNLDADHNMDSIYWLYGTVTSYYYF